MAANTKDTSLDRLRGELEKMLEAEGNRRVSCPHCREFFTVKGGPGYRERLRAIEALIKLDTIQNPPKKQVAVKPAAPKPVAKPQPDYRSMTDDELNRIRDGS